MALLQATLLRRLVGEVRSYEACRSMMTMSGFKGLWVMFRLARGGPKNRDYLGKSHCLTRPGTSKIWNTSSRFFCPPGGWECGLFTAFRLILALKRSTY